MLDFLGDGFSWTAQVQLPSWVGYQSRNGPYGSISSDEPSDGLVTIVVEPEGGKESPLTEQDRAGVQWWLDHEAEVASAVLEGLLAEYPRLQQDYGYEGRNARPTCPTYRARRSFAN